MATIGAFPNLKATSPAFRAMLVELARDVFVPGPSADPPADADALAAVMSTESGFKPDARNPNGGATGLIQFMPPTARTLGTTTDALACMSREAQMAYVRRYFERAARDHGPIRRRVDVYLAVFAPSKIGEPYDATVYASPSPEYKANSVFDKAKKGRIEVADLDSLMRARIAAAYARGTLDAPESAPPYPEPEPCPALAGLASGAWGWGLLLATVVGLPLAVRRLRARRPRA